MVYFYQVQASENFIRATKGGNMNVQLILFVFLRVRVNLIST